MLKQLVIHLKNIIFFKLIIYTLLTLGLLLLVPIFKNNLDKTIEQKQRAIVIVDNVKNKLDLIQTFGKEIEETMTQYDQLIINKIDLGCQKTKQFITDLMNLNTEFVLLTPITYTLSNNYDYKDFTTTSDIAVECNIIDINFTANDQAQYQALLKDLYEIIPTGSVLLEEHIETLDVITPSMIDQLQHHYSPNLLKIKIKLMLRNAKYKK